LLTCASKSLFETPLAKISPVGLLLYPSSYSHKNNGNGKKFKFTEEIHYFFK
jgi:hypothetical protein